MRTQDVMIKRRTSLDEIYKHFPDQRHRQKIYLHIDILTGSVSVGYDPLPGGHPEYAHRGLFRGYEIPVIPTVSRANQLMEDARPLVAVMIPWAELALNAGWVEEMKFHGPARGAEQQLRSIVCDPDRYAPQDRVDPGLLETVVVGPEQNQFSLDDVLIKLRTHRNQSREVA